MEFKKRYFYIITLAFIQIANFSFSQQDNTLFLLHNIPESNFTNPAVQISCKQYFGLPLLTSFHLNVNSTGFSYKSFSPGAANLDIDKLVSKMHYRDFISTEVHYTPISFGFMYDRKQYFNFAWTEKVDMKIFYPKKLFKLLSDGNTQFVGNGLKTINPGVNAVYYREFSFGYSKKLERNWTIGAHAKVLFGMAGMYTRRKPLKISMDENTFNLDAKWNPKMDVDLPLDITYNAEGYVQGVGLGEISPVSFLLNFKNQGLATDVGFIYKDKDITWSGSILDLGMIWWHDQNTNRFENEGHFAFRGATEADVDTLDAYISELTSNIKDQTRFTNTKKGFISFLNPRIYFGGTYPIWGNIRAGAQSRIEFYPGRPIVGLTFSAMTFGRKGSSLAINYSIMNGSFMNIGIGGGWGGEYFQFFAMTDNIMLFFKPEKARNANLRFGFNFIIGCHEKKKGHKLPKSTDCGCKGFKEKNIDYSRTIKYNGDGCYGIVWSDYF